MTTNDIVKMLKRTDLKATDLAEVMGAITARRAAIRSRLDEIEGLHARERVAAERAGDLEQLAALRQEADRLDDEMGVLYEFERIARQRHADAAKQERLEEGKVARKKLDQLLERARRALSDWTAARHALDAATTAIHLARLAAPQDERINYELDKEAFERVAAVLYPEGRPVEPVQARAALRQRLCAPPPPVFGEPEPNYVEPLGSLYGRRHS